MNVRDGDLLVAGATTPGVVLQEVADSGASPTVFVAGPTFERETALSVAAFARQSAAEVLVPIPFDDTRTAVREGDAGYLPARVSDYPRVIERLAADADRTIGVVETAPPTDGAFAPGTCGLCVEAIGEVADHLVAEVNPNAPRLPGLSIPAAAVDREVEAAYELPTVEPPDPDARTERVAENVARVVPDGATVQLGIGAVGEAAATALIKRENLGVHSGLVGPGVRTLIESGTVVRGSVAADPHPDAPFERPAMAAMAVGDRAFYEWLETSAAVALGPIARTHDPARVGENPAFVAINSALQVDLLGQVNAERIAGRQVSGPGGQPDYVRAARHSEGGRAIVALTSAVEGGPSKIVRGITAEGATTTPRDGPDFVVTDHGVADLRAANADRRAERLRGVAAPEYRPDLSGG